MVFNKVKDSHRVIVFTLAFVFLLFIVMFFLFSSYAKPEVIPSVSLMSKSTNYEAHEPGSFKVEKSATWIEKDKVRLNFDVDTVNYPKETNTKFIIVMDISSSMVGSKLEREKQDILDFLNSSSTNSSDLALVFMDSDSRIGADFSSSKSFIINQIHNVQFHGQANFYQAFVRVDEILDGSMEDCVVLFLTGSIPILNTPSEVGYYQYLKEKYPNMAVNSLLYGLGDYAFDSIRKISDSQYIVDFDSTSNMIEQAATLTYSYDSFILTDYVDDTYFEFLDSSSIAVSQGQAYFDSEESKVVWQIENLKSGSNLNMTLDLQLMEQYVNESGFYQVGKSTEISSLIYGIMDFVTTTDTPILGNNYSVIYDSNAPDGCVVENVQANENHFVYDVVPISKTYPICEGYQFKGWHIVDSSTYQLNDDYFVMPEGDVVLRAEWSKMTITKLMNGSIYVKPPAVMMAPSNNDAGGTLFWAYRDSITKVVFENTIHSILNEKYTFDVSESGNGDIIARLIPNTNDLSTYTLYIQGENGIVANTNSSYLFHQFQRLESVEGFEYFDTSNVTDMSYMFGWCGALTSLDLSSFDTSKVTTMFNMFRDNASLSSLDVSNFDTSNVTNMQWMLGGTESLSAVDLSSFNTAKVTDMSAMFAGTGLLSLDLSSFDTSNVTTMRVMFSKASNMESLKVDLDRFNTSKVTNFSNMFQYCYNLNTTIRISISTSTTPSYTKMFLDAANNGTAKIYVQLGTGSSATLNKMIATKSSSSQVLLYTG